jgi:hypothetical protein
VYQPRRRVTIIQISKVATESLFRAKVPMSQLNVMIKTEGKLSSGKDKDVKTTEGLNVSFTISISELS